MNTRLLLRVCLTGMLLHFWATFCIPCPGEMPVLESLWQEYGGEGLVILGGRGRPG